MLSFVRVELDSHTEAELCSVSVVRIKNTQMGYCVIGAT